ncbi:MAG: SDR family oxidoreductase [Acidimicrobiia bacterium]|jgi:NAD(P)-dependent dehydrogenase (short-subunit alcohol dehydrogenase family)|nr:SDR family oxidoreductase [Acidimicrobiia bacterium]
MDLRDRHVVVTGAAGGIGSALARRFHSGGARVTMSDLRGADSLADELPGSLSVAADISTEAGNVDLIEAARSHHGEIDLFFANAGVAMGTDPMDAEGAWDTSFAVNLHAHRWAARHLLPAWIERGEGYFCSTASAAGLLAQIGSAPYSVTKHGAVAFAEWLAITYGARGLRVSCLCPQGVNTDMLNSDVVGGGGGDVVRAVGTVLEPAEVADIVHDAIVEERFLILPHPEVGDYLRHKGDDPARWISGMQRLQQRTLGL